MSTDLAESVPYTITTRQSLGSFAVDLRVSVEILLQINPHIEELEDLVAGIPVNLPRGALSNLEARQELEAGTRPVTPFDWAIVEWEKGVHEYSGPQESNPEIEKYHAVTSGVQPDDVAWCSSFVNWCVRRSGIEGTNNKAARSWHKWGLATATPKRGDIVVFKRKDSTWKGHVGFLWEEHDSFIRVLGGNQSNSVRVSSYPKDGRKYALLSIRNT